MGSPFDPGIPLLGLYPEDLKSAYYSDTATSMFIVTQFTYIYLIKMNKLKNIKKKEYPFKGEFRPS